MIVKLLTEVPSLLCSVWNRLDDRDNWRRKDVMVRWEYLSVDFESHPMNQGYGGLQHYNFVSYIEASRLGLEPDRDVQYMETVLDIVGNNGWELISLVPIFIEDHDTLKRTKFLKAVFKRPKDSDD